MKKILVVFNALRFSKHTMEYAADLAKATNSLLVGVFLHDITLTRFTYTYAWDVQSQNYLDYEKIEKEDEEKMKQIVTQFESICKSTKTEYTIHRHTGVPSIELLKESTFADLILVDTKTSFYSIGNSLPSTFLKDILSKSKCPVLIIPDKPHEIKQIIVAYDGSDSSVYAMKMFSYIFPEWSEMNTTIVSVNQSSSNHLPQGRNVRDLASHHFKKVTYKILNGDPLKELEKYLLSDGKDFMVVMGAYGRSAWSRVFHSSMSNKILKDIKVPLFITHQ